MAGTVIDSLIVTLGLDGADYKKGAEDVLVTNKKVMDHSNVMAISLESSGKQLADYWRGFKAEALAVLAILGGGTGLVALLESAANAASATARSAANVGTSVSKFSAWQAVAPMVGASSEDVTGAFGTVSGAAQAQLHGQQNAAGAFIQNYLKVPLLNANGTERDTDDIMKDIAAVYQKNSAVTDNWFNSQIGFSQGFGNELQMPDLIAQLGALVTETKAQAKAAAAVTKQEGLVEAEMTGLKNTLMEIGAPALTKGLHDFAAGIWAINQAFKGNFGPLAQGFDHDSGSYPATPPGAGDNPANTTTFAHIMKRFEAAGYSQNFAAAMASQAYSESSMNAAAGAGTAHRGLFQWSAERRAQILQGTGIDVWKDTNPNDHITAAIWELQHTQKAAADKISAAAKLGPGYAGMAADNYYEVSGDNKLQQVARGLRAELYANIGPSASTSAAALAMARASQGLPLNVTHVLNVLRAQQHAAQESSAAAAKQRPVSVTTGDIHVHTAAKDADGIAKSVKKSLNNHLVMMTNSGVI